LIVALHPPGMRQTLQNQRSDFRPSLLGIEYHRLFECSLRMRPIALAH
jgi:hypothetical protein